jgi:hypothetical protein
VDQGKKTPLIHLAWELAGDAFFFYAHAQPSFAARREQKNICFRSSFALVMRYHPRPWN